MDPKKDSSFQAILAKIIADTTATNVPDTVATEPCFYAGGDEKEKTADALANVRVEFFWSHCFHDLHALSGKPQFSYDVYRAIRDTPAAQRFLRENPLFFTRIDHALCEVANSIRKNWKRSTPAVKTR